MHTIRLFVSAMVIVLAAEALAQPQPDTILTDPLRAPDVRVVIDVSGSMKQNDPNNLRRPALELLVQLLPDKSKAGVWSFGRYINMLVPHREVTEKWRRDATQKATQINSLGLFTNIGEALEKAGYDLDRPNDKYRTSLVLLTDGMVDISRNNEENQAEWRRIVDEILPRFKQAGYTIHTIALSDNADIQLLNRMALATDGVAAVAKTADDLLKIFLKALDRAAPAEQVPLQENRFVVDSSIEEFTALIFRKPGSNHTRLVGPDRHEYSFSKEQSDVSWYRSDDYDLITVQGPLEGEWRVLAAMDPDSRVTVVSNLNLVVKPLKNNIYKGDILPLSLLFQEDGKTIDREEFLKLLDIEATLSRREPAASWRRSLSAEPPPSNGVFSTTFSMFDEEGYYDLKVLVDGKSFKREFSHTVSVREPFGIELKKDILAGVTSYVVTVNAYSQTVDRGATHVVARIRDPDGDRSVKPLSLTEVDNWRLKLTPSLEGEYTLGLRITGKDKQGRDFEYNPDTLQFRVPDAEDPFNTEPESEPEPKPEPEPVAKLEPEPETQAPDSGTESSQWPLYLGLGVGNLLILALAFVAYRMIMGGKGGDSLKQLEDSVDTVVTESETSEPSEPTPKVATMAEIDPPSGDQASGKKPGATDEDLAASLLEDDLDLASDSDIEIPEGVSVSDLEREEEVDDDAEEDSGFSLDEFDSGDFDDEEEDLRR
ncbi:MAG: VWA domain-containing protein [Exilibacterium sp.]